MDEDGWECEGLLSVWASASSAFLMTVQDGRVGYCCMIREIKVDDCAETEGLFVWI